MKFGNNSCVSDSNWGFSGHTTHGRVNSASHGSDRLLNKFSEEIKKKKNSTSFETREKQVSVVVSRRKEENK